MPPKVRKDQLLKFADDVTQRMADWQHKKDAACSDRVNEVLLKSVNVCFIKSKHGNFLVPTKDCER